MSKLAWIDCNLWGPQIQVVPSDTQENGQKESKRDDPGDEEERNDRQDRLSQEEKMEDSVQISMDAETSSPGHDVDMKTGENFIRRVKLLEVSGIMVSSLSLFFLL